MITFIAFPLWIKERSKMRKSKRPCKDCGKDWGYRDLGLDQVSQEKHINVRESPALSLDTLSQSDNYTLALATKGKEKTQLPKKRATSCNGLSDSDLLVAQTAANIEYRIFRFSDREANGISPLLFRFAFLWLIVVS